MVFIENVRLNMKKSVVIMHGNGNRRSYDDNINGWKRMFLRIIAQLSNMGQDLYMDARTT